MKRIISEWKAFDCVAAQDSRFLSSDLLTMSEETVRSTDSVVYEVGVSHTVWLRKTTRRTNQRTNWKTSKKPTKERQTGKIRHTTSRTTCLAGSTRICRDKSVHPHCQVTVLSNDLTQIKRTMHSKFEWVRMNHTIRVTHGVHCSFGAHHPHDN